MGSYDDIAKPVFVEIGYCAQREYSSFAGRIDKKIGWAEKIYGNIITNNLIFYKIKILDEFLLRPKIINCFVKFNNKVLLKSRDSSYYRSKKRGLL